MSEKRYAIVRVEGRCPREAEMNWDIKCVPTLECDKCLTRINYGDTKKQLLRKIAQGIIIASKKKQIYIANPKAFSKAVSKIIVEFLGVEE